MHAPRPSHILMTASSPSHALPFQSMPQGYPASVRRQEPAPSQYPSE